MKLGLVWAMAQNGVIGRNNSLPWHLPEELKYFKRITLGKPVIMGRKTFESIGKPLPGRTNIVITRNLKFHAEGVTTVHSLAAARVTCENIAAIDSCEEAMVIGGAEIFRLALPLADRLYLTEIHADVAGDTFFPDFDRGDWRETTREDVAAAGPIAYAYSMVVLDRVKGERQ